eukprot:854222-Pleurochrysis_carterae.AAC.2
MDSQVCFMDATGIDRPPQSKCYICASSTSLTRDLQSQGRLRKVKPSRRRQHSSGAFSRQH